MALTGGLGCNDAVEPGDVVASVTINPATTLLVFLGETATLRATARDANGNAITGEAFAWESSDTTIATVGSSGLVTAIANGTTTITAKTQNVAGEAEVTVSQIAATITLEPDAVTMSRLGQTRLLETRTYDAGGASIRDDIFTWESSDDQIATVAAAGRILSTSSGLVTAVANGAASVTATAHGVSAEASVTVQLFPRVDVAPVGAAMSGVGAMQTFVVEAWDANGNQVPSPAVTWSSLNPNIATIEAATGEATALTSGQVTLEAEVDGVIGYALLTVSVPGVAPVAFWSVDSPPSLPLATAAGVWGSSPSDVYAVSAFGPLRHNDGTGWRTMVDETATKVIWGSSSSDVYAVGVRQVLQYDGTTWVETEVPRVGTHLLALWGASPRDIYAAGSFDPVMHYDGANWSSMTEVVSGQLRGMWGTTPNDIYTAGMYGIFHYDGTELREITEASAGLTAVWGTSSSDVYAVGDGGTIFHFDGTAWNEMVSNTTVDLNGLWGTSPSDVYAVGDAGVVIHYDESGWSEMTSDTDVDLLGIWGTSVGDVYAVGESGVILRGQR